MRRTIRSVGVVFIAMLGAIGLAVGSAFSAALAFGAVALIVPGTGTHNIDSVMGYKENAANRFIDPSGVPCTSGDGCTLDGVPYPASFFPLVIFPGWCPGLQCDTWNASVGAGVTQLDTQLKTVLDAPVTPDNKQIIIFGYSQGGAVVSREAQAILNDPSIDTSRLSIVTIGNINNPRGLWSRLSFLPTIPLLDISFGPQLPTEGIKSTNYSFEYDPVGDAPSYWGNPLAMLNALAAFEYVHGYYLVPNSNGTPDETMPYGYDNASLAAAIADPHNSQTYQDATFVLIPQKGPLPIYQPFLDLAKQTGTGAIINPLVALLNPVTKLLVNLGYDRVTNPGIPQMLSILPFNPFTFNPVTFSVQFVQAIVQGVQDALNGGASMLAPTTVPTPQIQAVQSFSRLASATVQNDPPATLGDKKDKTEAVVENLAANQADQNQADQNQADQNQVDQDAAAKAAAAQAAADAAAKAEADKQAALDKAAADKAAADKAAADKAAADKAAADKAAKEAKAAADKAAADKDAAAQAAADKAKEAADNAKAAGAAGDGPVKTDGTVTATTEPATSGTAAPEKQAA